EAFDVLLLLHQQAGRNEEGEIGVDVPGRLEAPVEPLLNQFPDRVAVRANGHAAFDRRVVGELRTPHHIQVPLGKILRLRRDLGDLTRAVLLRLRVALLRHFSRIPGGFRPRLPWFRKPFVSSVYRRVSGNRSGSGRPGSPRGAGPRAQSTGPPWGCPPHATPPHRAARRRRCVRRSRARRDPGWREPASGRPDRETGRPVATSDPELPER